MRIGALSKQAGVPIATIKYYLREGLLPAGERTKVNQAEYGDEHVRRLVFIRGVMDVGRASIATIRAMLACADTSPERYCWRCGGPNVPWSAPSPLWNEVMRGGDINGSEIHNGIICPTCFAVLAEAAGVAKLWRLYAERVLVPLATVAPSGRVWNPETWLWKYPTPSGPIELNADDVAQTCHWSYCTEPVSARSWILCDQHINPDAPAPVLGSQVDVTRADSTGNGE